MTVTQYGDYTDTSVEISGVGSLDLVRTFDCGQCFRFEAEENGSVSGIAHGRWVNFSCPEKGVLRIAGATADDFDSIWRTYLDLDRDYDGLADSFKDDEVLSKAAKCASGIRILKQEPWETLCSFIISQNNNIPRIKGLIEAISQKYGTPVKTPRGIRYAFPTAKALADAGEEELFKLKTGFRAKYIADAAKKVASGELDLEKVAALPTAEASDMLCTVRGVGPKVAACTLLFGFGRGDCFPIDVWIRRVLDEFYPDGLDIAALGDRAGIAQQYLFYYKRYLKGE